MASTCVVETSTEVAHQLLQQYRQPNLQCHLMCTIGLSVSNALCRKYCYYMHVLFSRKCACARLMPLLETPLPPLPLILLAGLASLYDIPSPHPQS